MIARATIKRYRCLRDVSVELGPFNVLIGPNDAGKSTLIEALGLPRRSVGAGFDPSTSVMLTSADGEFVGVDDAGRWVPSVTGKVERWFDVAEPLRLDPNLIAKQGHRGTGAIAHMIASRGQGTSAHLAATALGDRKRFELIQEGIREVTKGRVEEVRIGEDLGSGYPMSFRLHDGTDVPAATISSGLLLYLAFLCIIHRADSPGVLLLEEPENGLHPLRLHELVDRLRTLTEEGVQIVMTTHSPDLLNACRPEEVIILRRPDRDSSTHVDRLPKDFDRIAMRSTLGEIWASRGEEGLLDILPTVNPSVRAAG